MDSNLTEPALSTAERACPLPEFILAEAGQALSGAEWVWTKGRPSP